MEKRINWISVIVFYAISLLIAWSALQYFSNNIWAGLKGLGPMIGALVVLSLWKRDSRAFSTWGSRPSLSLLALLIPLSLAYVIGIRQTDFFDNIHINGLAMAALGLTYAFAEEYGWRGYLQEALLPLGLKASAMIIGVLWYLWHFTWLSPHTNISNELSFLALCLFGSWGMAVTAVKTQSIILPACLHFVFNLFTVLQLKSIEVAIPIASILAWVYLVQYWEKDTLEGSPSQGMD